MEEFNSANISQITGSTGDITFVDMDGTVWIMGYRAGGGRYDEEKRKLRKLPCPEGKSVKKVVNGKTCRWMLTTDGSVYGHGQFKHYQATSSRSEHFGD